MYWTIILFNLMRQCIYSTVCEQFAVDVGEDYMETCVVDVLSSETQHGADIAIINNDLVTNDLIRQIHETQNVKLYVKDYNVPVGTSPSTFVIYVADLLNFEELIDKLDRDWNRKPEALYIIAIKENEAGNTNELYSVLWDYHIIHVLVITGDINETASLYSYFPYAEGQCGRYFNNTVKISDCERVKKLDIIKLLREADKPVLENCTLQVLTHNYPPLIMSDRNSSNMFSIGIEQLLLDLLAEMECIYLNYTYYPETHDFGDVSDNFTVTGILEKLYENEADIVCGGFSLNNRRSVFFSYVISHLAFEDSAVVITPTADLVERWKTVYLMFNSGVWMLLLFVLLFSAAVLSAFNSLFGLQKKHNKSSELLNLFGSATQNMALNRRERVYKNLIIVHWLWFTFLVNSFYETRLTSYYTYRVYEPQLDTYIDLHVHNIIPCISLYVAQFLKRSGNVALINEEFLQNDGCETAEKALVKVSQSRRMYTVTQYLQYLWWATRHPEEKERVHIMRENIYNSLYSLYLKRGFPLLQDFNAQMLRLVEYGFVQAIKDIHGISHKHEGSEVGSFKLFPLKLEDFRVPFIIFAIGLIIAFIIFIFEVVHKNLLGNKLLHP